MPEPVSPAADWLVTRGNAAEIGYREYDPAADDGVADPHGDAEPCAGVKGPERRVLEGNAVVTRATWTVTGLAAMPLLRSHLVGDDGRVWLVDDVTPDPAGGGVYQIETTLDR